MFQNLVICFNAVLPLSIYMIIGMLVRKFGLLTEYEVRRVNKMVFTAFYPALMFDNLYYADASSAFEWHFMCFAAVFVIVLFLTLCFVIRRIEPNDLTCGAMIHAMYRSNCVLMGLPIAINIFGEGNVSVVASMLVVVVPMYNVLAVFLLEYFNGEETGFIGKIKPIFKNPIILGAIAAGIFMFFDWPVPEVIGSVIQSMSSATTPIALILLGASFSFESVRNAGKQLALTVFVKLILVPAIGLPIVALLGYRDVEFVALLIMMTAPTAVSSFSMAQAMGSDEELAGNAVIFTTPLSVITMFLWLFLYKTLGMF